MRRSTTAPVVVLKEKSCIPGSTSTARPSRREAMISPSIVTCTSRTGSAASSLASITIEGISASICPSQRAHSCCTKSPHADLAQPASASLAWRSFDTCRNSCAFSYDVAHERRAAADERGDCPLPGVEQNTMAEPQRAIASAPGLGKALLFGLGKRLLFILPSPGVRTTKSTRRLSGERRRVVRSETLRLESADARCVERERRVAVGFSGSGRGPSHGRLGARALQFASRLGGGRRFDRLPRLLELAPRIGRREVDRGGDQAPRLRLLLGRARRLLGGR